MDMHYIGPLGIEHSSELLTGGCVVYTCKEDADLRKLSSVKVGATAKKRNYGVAAARETVAECLHRYLFTAQLSVCVMNETDSHLV